MHEHAHRHKFDPSQAHKLENPERTQWLPPHEIIGRLELEPGWQIADIGAGTGYFALPMARAVGSQGQVLAVDLEPALLARIQAKLTGSDIINVRCVQGEASSTGLAAASCHCAFYANVWHEFDDHGAVLEEALRILKPAGEIAILDWRPDVAPDHGPPIAHRLSAAQAMASLQSLGFEKTRAENIAKYTWLVRARAPQKRA